MSARLSSRRGIKDVFYETRVLLGRQYTLRRFAGEVLEGSIDPVMLGYIEKGKRLPSEVLVRRLAVVRKQDPQELLALLWRDRMLYVCGRELRRVLRAPRLAGEIENAQLAVWVSQAIAALPDDGSWIAVHRWRQQFRERPDKRARESRPDPALMRRVERLLRARGLVEVRNRKVRRRGRHFVARDREERQALALEFCAIFIKGLLDKLALSEAETGTYLRDHYLHIDPKRLPEFNRRLDEALKKLAKEFAADKTAATRFLNVLVTATPF